MNDASVALMNEFARLDALTEMQAILHIQGVTIEEVLAKKRTAYCLDGTSNAGVKAVANTRAELMCLLRNRGLSYPQIARAFCRDHSTVITTIKRFNATRDVMTKLRNPLRPAPLDQRVLRLEREVAELKSLVAVLTMRDA